MILYIVCVLLLHYIRPLDNLKMLKALLHIRLDTFLFCAQPSSRLPPASTPTTSIVKKHFKLRSLTSTTYSLLSVAQPEEELQPLGEDANHHTMKRRPRPPPRAGKA
jgi:hypothetical protein